MTSIVRRAGRPPISLRAPISMTRFSILLLGALVFGSDALAQHSWYMAPDGDDAGTGAIEHPFATIARAQKQVAPGDTVFVRGGTYRMTEAQIARTKAIFAAVIYLDKSGTPEKPITYRAYEDEKPVFDFSEVKPAGDRVSAFSVSGSWLRLAGLEVTGVQVTLTGHTQSISFESNG